MKKSNNAFMVAYIAFIFISAIVRAIRYYPMWDNLVMAISVAGVFLAVADYFDNFSACVERITSYGVLHINSDLENLKSKNQDLLCSELKICEEFQNEVAQLEKMCKKMDSKIAKMIKTTNETACRPNVYTFLGYFSFFVISTFGTRFIQLAIPADVLSMFAFGFVVLNQYVHNWLDENEQRYKKEIMNLNNQLDKVIEYARKLRTRYELEMVI